MGLRAQASDLELTTIFTFLLYELALLTAGGVWIHARFPGLAADVEDDLRRLLASGRRSWNQEPALHRLCLGILVLVGLIVRLVYMRQPMRYDEAWTYVHYASRSLLNALSNYSQPNNHVFNTLLMWALSHVLGSSPPVLRLPALLSGLAMVPLVYVVGRRLTSAGGALFGAAVIASTPCMVLYSTNARGYSIVCVAFLALLALGTVVDVAHASSFSLAFAGTTALGMFAIPTMVYPAGAAVGMALLQPRTDASRNADRLLRLMDGAVLAVVLTLALYGPIIVRSGFHPLVGNRFITPLGWMAFLRELPGFLTSLGHLLVLGLPTGIWIVLSLSVLVSIAFPNRRANLRRASAITIVWCVALLIVTRRPPFARVWLFMVPLLALMAGDGMAWLASRALGRAPRSGWLIPITAVTVAVALGGSMIRSRAVFRSDESGTFREAAAVARILLDRAEPTDYVVASTQSSAPLDYYLVTSGGHPLARYAQPAEARRILIVVNGHDGQTVDGLRRSRTDIDWDRFSAPHLIDRIGPAVVYACDRRTRGGGVELRPGLVPTLPEHPAPSSARPPAP